MPRLPLKRGAWISGGLPAFLFLVLFSTDLLSGGPAAQDAKAEWSPLSGFGRKHLINVELIAEVTVAHIYQMGLGVDVVKIRLDRVLLDRLPPSKPDKSERLVLAHRGEFTAGTKLLLFLKRFEKSDRLTTLHRISHLEQSYQDKVRLVEDYLRIERIPEEKKRLETLVRMALENLKDESYWIRCYSAWELDGLVREKRWPFTTGDVAYLESIEKDAENPSFKKTVTQARERMAEAAVEGPPTLEAEVKKPEKKETGGSGKQRTDS